MRSGEDEDRAELLRYADQVLKNLNSIRDCANVIAASDSDASGRLMAVLWQGSYLAEMESTLAAMQLRLMTATVH